MDFSSVTSSSTTPRSNSKVKPRFRELRQRRLQNSAEDPVADLPALQLYQVPPTMDITLLEFEDLAVQRLKVLRVFEKLNLSGKTKFSNDWYEGCLNDLRDAKPTSLRSFYELADRVDMKKVKDEDIVNNRRNDWISHFILRLAYCRSEELRRWFVSHETDLFRFRWWLLKTKAPEELDHFTEVSGLNYQPISEDEKRKKMSKLSAASQYASPHDHFYKVNWLEAMDLVRARRVYVEAGKAFIPSSELLSLVIGVFRSSLSRDLVLTCRALPVLEDDTRLVNMITNLDKRYTGDDYSNKTVGRVMPGEIEGLAKRNFPLCMSTIQNILTSSHHIKYKARLQYGLFLKGIGLTLEDAMKFFRGEFTKKGDVDVDKFEKEYAYGIRYNYGKEGKKKNWQPWDCMRIIMENIGPGENHGCPFRHHESKTVRQRIESYGLKKEEVDAIHRKVEEGHYTIACGMHFSALHLRELSTGSVTHPNQWYLESRGEVGSNGPSKANKNVKTVKVRMVVNGLMGLNYDCRYCSISFIYDVRIFHNIRLTMT